MPGSWGGREEQRNNFVLPVSSRKSREGGGPRLPGALKDEPALSNPIYASTWPAPSRLRKSSRGSSEGRNAEEGAGLDDNLRG